MGNAAGLGGRAICPVTRSCADLVADGAGRARRYRSQPRLLALEPAVPGPGRTGCAQRGGPPCGQRVVVDRVVRGRFAAQLQPDRPRVDGGVRRPRLWSGRRLRRRGGRVGPGPRRAPAPRGCDRIRRREHRRPDGGADHVRDGADGRRLGAGRVAVALGCPHFGPGGGHLPGQPAGRALPRADPARRHRGRSRPSHRGGPSPPPACWPSAGLWRCSSPTPESCRSR